MLALETKTITPQSLTPASFQENNLSKACQLLEEATDMLVEAGRILSQVKESTKRKFTKILLENGLEKTQVNKLIKASAVADEIPTVVARRLGTSMLTQLGQPKNRAALESIDASDTQISVVQKIKEYRISSTPTPREEVRLIGKKKGQEKLVIEVAGCPETKDIYEEFKTSGLSALDWLQNLRNKQPKLKEVLNEEINYGPILALSEPWNSFPQEWKHGGKECSYDVVDGQRIIHWDRYKIKVEEKLAAKYINPRTFLDFELISPGAKVSILDKNWNGVQANVQEIRNNKAIVTLEGGDFLEKSFSINDLCIIEPSPRHWIQCK